MPNGRGGLRIRREQDFSTDEDNTYEFARRRCTAYKGGLYISGRPPTVALAATLYAPFPITQQELGRPSSQTRKTHLEEAS
jgi:hypothetical protein